MGGASKGNSIDSKLHLYKNTSDGAMKGFARSREASFQKEGCSKWKAVANALCGLNSSGQQVSDRNVRYCTSVLAQQQVVASPVADLRAAPIVSLEGIVASQQRSDRLPRTMQ